jgi:hypothetical protein
MIVAWSCQPTFEAKPPERLSTNSSAPAYEAGDLGKRNLASALGAALTLLRTVGHVLEKVDGARGATYRKAVGSALEAMESRSEIACHFWEFVEQERNNVLKEYRFGVEPEPTYLRLD